MFNLILFQMTVEKNESKAMSLLVTDSLSVTVIPNTPHEFLMTSKEVAHGYGTSTYVIRTNLMRHSTELIEGKHYIKGCNILSPPLEKGDEALNKLFHKNAQPHQIFWTKRGIVRLGFYVSSDRARLFRDWAEDLIIEKSTQPQQASLFSEPMLQLTGKRNHNRLTQERVIDILADVCRIDDKELRLSLTSKVLGGFNHGN